MTMPAKTDAERDRLKQIGRERYEEEFSANGFEYGDYPDPYGDGTTFYTYAIDGVFLRRCPMADGGSTPMIFDARKRVPVEPSLADSTYLIDPNAPQSDWINHPNAIKASYR